MSATLTTVALDRIRVMPQVRKHFDEASLKGLAASIAESGLLQPLLCSADGESLRLIDGERRLRACRLLGMKEVTILVVSDPVSIVEALTRQLACNLQREDLTVIERAEAIQALMQQGPMTADQAAKRLGQSPATVSRTLSVLKLPESIRVRVADGDIPADAAYLLARIEEPERQSALAEEVVGGTLTRDALNRKIKGRHRWEKSRSTSVCRVTALLGGGRSVTIAGKGLSIESLIESLEQLLTRARKAKSQALSLETFVRTLRDQAVT